MKNVNKVCEYVSLLLKNYESNIKLSSNVTNLFRNFDLILTNIYCNATRRTNF